MINIAQGIFLFISLVIYALLLILIRTLLAIISSLQINKYIERKKQVSYKELLVSPYASGISIIARLHNDENTIIDTIREWLVLAYNNFDIIVVNDGSTDTTLEKLISYYQLEEVNYAANNQLKTKEVYSYYKSKNPAFSKLLVVDKTFGCIADALNAGINASEKQLVFCLEQQCFLEPDSLLKLAKVFLDEEKKVVAVNCVVNVANRPKIDRGRSFKLNFPRTIWPSFQAIEYFKLFFLKSPALNRMNFMHPVSGTFSLIDKEILLLSGGFNVKVSNPGFELLVRIRRYMLSKHMPHKIISNLEPVCWVNVQGSLKTLSRNRIEKARSFLLTYKLNKEAPFNRRYSVLGLNLAYLWFSELIGPVIKVVFLVVAVIICAMGAIDKEWVFILLLTIYFFSVLLSLIAILFQEKLYRLYSGKEMLRVMLMCFAEPIIYTPLTIYWKIAAMLRKKQSN